MPVERGQQPHPTEVLLICGGVATDHDLVAPGSRVAALKAIARRAFPSASIVAARPGEATAFDPRRFAAVIADAPPLAAPGASGPEPVAPSEWLDSLRDALAGGTSLLCLAGALTDVELAGWLGVAPHAGAGTTSRAEWFCTVPSGASDLTERLPGEFPVVDRLAPIEARHDDFVTLVHVSIGFSNRPVVIERNVGTARIVVAGLGNEPEALGHSDLVTLFARALRPTTGLRRRNRPIGVGIVGYGPFGGMGLYHGLAAQATTGLEIVAACDSDAARRKTAEEEFPGLRAYETVDELLSDDSVELAIVATPPASHASIARRLLEGGRHVALEKPMTLLTSDATALIELAAANQLAVTVHQSRRWDADYLAIRRAINVGLVGEVFNVQTFVGGFEHPCRAWHSEESVSGGAVYDWGSHHLDWILQLMGGFPSELVAHGHKRVWHDVSNLDQVRVRVTWADGREAEFLQSDVAGVRLPKFYVQGTAGTIVGHYRPLRFERVEPGVGYIGSESHHAEAPVDLTLARYEPGYGLTTTVLPPLPVDRYGFHRNLADHLVFGETLAVTPESARDVVALLEAAQRSTDEGNRAIRLEQPE